MQPITRIIDVNVYSRPGEGGLMLAATSRTHCSIRQALCQRGSTLLICRWTLGACEVRETRYVNSCPSFSACPDEIKLRVHRGGLPTMTADGEHTVRPVPSADYR